MTIAVVAGVDCPPFVLADCVYRFGAVGDLFPGIMDGEVIPQQSQPAHWRVS